MRIVCKLAVLAATAFFGISLTTAEANAAVPATGKTYHIVYHDDRNNIIRRDLCDAEYTFDANDPYFFVTMPLINTAWCTEYLTPDQIQDGVTYSADAVIFDTDDKLSDKGFSLPLTEDLHLYPRLQYGVYVRFDAQGGTPQPNQFLNIGIKAVEPDASEMKKTGYTFGGWYNTAACADGDTFDFNWAPTRDELTSPTAPTEKRVYAKWVPAASTYKVFVWLEKAEHPIRTSLADAKAHYLDDYDFGTFITKNGTTGTDVAFTNADRASADVKNVTWFEDDNKFPVYFYDNENGSYAQSLSEASVSDINNPGAGAFKGIAPDGTTVVNVFYRRITFDLSLGVLSVPYGYWWQLPMPIPWDNNYDKFDLTIRDGETFGAAIERSGQTVSTATYELFHQNSMKVDYPYTGHIEFVFSSDNRFGWGDIFEDETLFGKFVTSEDIYYAQWENYQNVTDGFKFNWALSYCEKTDRVFSKSFYYQTIASAKAGNETDMYNPDLSHYANRTDEFAGIYDMDTDGFVNESEEGFEYWFCQCVKRNGSTVTRSSYTGGPFTGNGSSGEKYEYYQKGDYVNGYRLEIFQRRKSYTVTYVTGTGYVEVDANNLRVIYEDNLNEANATTGGKAFTPDVTYYVDSEGRKFVFKGWYDNSVFVGSPVNPSTYSMPARNVQLFAKWEEMKVTVTFDALEGTVGADAQQTMATEISVGTVPANPGEAQSSDLSGHILFNCWLKNGVPYDFVEPIYEDVTLEAFYYTLPENPFYVTYKPGKGTGTDVFEFADHGYLYNSNAGVQDFFADWKVPAGKLFLHWVDGDGNTFDPDDEIFMKRDTVLTAVYEGGHADIEIKREGLYEDETAIFDIYRMDGDEKTFVMRVSLTGIDEEGTTVSRKLINMEPGTYVVEETEWNWTYDKGTTTVTEDGKTPVASDTNGTGTGSVDYYEELIFNFTGDPKTDTDLTKHGEDAAINKFAK